MIAVIFINSVLFLSIIMSGFGFVRFNVPRSALRLKATPEASYVQSVADNLFYSKKKFEDMDLRPNVLESLTAIGITTPSKIQWLAYRTIASGKNTILAEQTGSGKTLAYLIPVLQKMIDSKEKATSEPARDELQSPSIVVISPTTELANQVARVVRSLAHTLLFRTSCITSMSDYDAEDKKIRLGVDVLVVTPGALNNLLNRKKRLLSSTETIVLDEADVLFMDETFPLQVIGRRCPETAQFIFTTATLPPEVVEQIQAEFPDVVSVSGPGLHRIAPNVAEFIIDCSGQPGQKRNSDTVFENKKEALLQVLYHPSNRKMQRTLIFCNTIDQCRRVENILQREDRSEKDRVVYAYHSAVEMQTRDDNLMKFCKPLLAKPVFLISTDRASRGMDFDRAHVDHVILFDFPHEPSEYIRRVGRTGRAGRSGKVTILAFGKQVKIAREVIETSTSGKKITPSVPVKFNEMEK